MRQTTLAMTLFIIDPITAVFHRYVAFASQRIFKNENYTTASHVASSDLIIYNGCTLFGIYKAEYNLIFHIVWSYSAFLCALPDCASSGDSYTTTSFDTYDVQPSSSNPMGNPQLGNTQPRSRPKAHTVSLTKIHRARHCSRWY